MTVHKEALRRICPENWLSWDLEMLLLSDLSTAAPVATDLYVSSLSPASNELVCPTYSRKAVTALTPTWVDGRWNVAFSPVTWTDLENAGITPQGVTGAALYVKETTDFDSWLVLTALFTEVPLDASDFVVVADGTGALSVGEP